MSNMFSGCSGLTSLNLSNFNTSQVTDMSYMFSDCSGLTRLDLSSFYTWYVTDMSGMFSGCSSLTSLDLSNFSPYHYGYDYDPTGMWFMCFGLSTTSGRDTIICPLDIENAIKEENPYYDPDYDYSTDPEALPDFVYTTYYISGLPTSGVTFIWVRP